MSRALVSKPSASKGVVQRSCKSCGPVVRGPSSCPECNKKKRPLQTRLQVSTPGDAGEREAERAADAVMSGRRPQLATRAVPSLLQRDTVDGGVPDAGTQKAPQEPSKDGGTPSGQPDAAGQAAASAQTASATPTCSPQGFKRADYLKQAGTSTNDFGLTALDLTNVKFPEVVTQKVKGGVELQTTNAVLPAISSVFTTVDTFVEGEAHFLNQGGAETGCPSGKLPIRWIIAQAGADKIQAGEQEHCSDFQLAFDLSLKRYADGVNALAASGRKFASQDAAEKAVTGKVGAAPSDWFNVFLCLTRKSLKRDKQGLHNPNPRRFPPRLGGKCEVRLVLDGTTFPGVGTVPSADLIKDCNEKGAAKPAAKGGGKVPKPDFSNVTIDSSSGEQELDDEALVQRRAITGAHEAPAEPAGDPVDTALASAGRALDGESRAFMESHFERDFSGVRVHTGEAAVASAEALHAQAYTVGSDIVFNRGMYAPHTAGGRHLLAHELTHVVQQVGAPTVQRAETVQRREIEETPAELQAGGAPLPALLRESLEGQFGAGLGEVRLHDDSESHTRARRLSARAFTYGQHVHFAAGRLAPNTPAGLHLLAHEVAHTLQQRGAAPSAAASMETEAHDAPLEREADAHADAIVAGRETRVRTGSAGGSLGPRLQRQWDRPGASDCSDIAEGRWLRKVVVEQESPQFVTLHWSDGALETSGCSTGKGHCCVTAQDGVACDRERSRRDGSNCTPISAGAEFPITERFLDHNGWKFWSTFVWQRGIGLHEHHTVDSTPLSHGCVRLPLQTARHIFCGARQNRTLVEVRGFARPNCANARLRREWVSDITNTTIPGRDGEEYRNIVRDGYGRDLTDTERQEVMAGTSTLDVPPRCPSARTAAGPTLEEFGGRPLMTTPVSTTTDPARPGRTATVPGQIAPSIPQQILEDSGFESLIPRFTAALADASSVRNARSIVQREGRNLWSVATRRAQRATNPDTDDRPLYWARLEMTRALRAFQPTWPLSASDRDALLELLESSSRGRDTADFGRRRSDKRILISGFDPFGLSERDRGNPSGAAVLSLDGQRLTAGRVSGRVEGTIFPVRFADFDAGSVESFFGPYLTGDGRVDMVMTISEGGGSTNFEVEEWAARRRTNNPSFTDNMGRRGDGRAPSAPLPASPGGPQAGATIDIPGAGPGDQFLPTRLPSAVRSSLRSSPLTAETEVTEVPAGQTVAVRRPSSGPTPGSTAIRGSGGNFLSNEIFYRTRLLRDSRGSSVPMGHLHTPGLDAPSASSAAAFETARNTIVARIRQILIDTLPSL